MFLNRAETDCTLNVLKSISFGALIVCAFSGTAISQIFLKDQFPNLSFDSPVGIYYPNDTSNRLCVLEQGGIIRIFQNDSSATSSKVFLDIRDHDTSGGEMGLLGLAFHPQFSTNGFFYIDYTRGSPLRTVISRFHVSASHPDSADASSETIILEQLQPFDNHNGGQLAFGPDGYLYIGFGDGGSSGDPFGNGQSTATLLGKILRIDVDSTSGMKQYTIPPGNPFYGDTMKKQEIFAYGLRNPWRFSFDGETLWCGDVGQNAWEEIDTVLNGRNYGWNTLEGTHCYNPSTGCDSTGLTLPIWEYGHDAGRCSITGGFVYRGGGIPLLRGKYIYGDFCTGEIWTLTPKPSAPPVNSLLVGANTNVSSFGEDKFQEMYVCDYSGGRIYKLWTTPPAPFMLVSPADHALNQPDVLTCTWRSSTGASTYQLEVSSDSLFASLVVNDSLVSDTSREIGPLADSTLYFWRVRAMNGGGSTAFTPFRRFTTSSSSIHFHVIRRWNIISLPAIVADGRKNTLFPLAVSNAYAYDHVNGYQTRDTLFPGKGYWLKFGDSTTIGVVGTPINTDTIDVVQGWNMVGSVSQPIPTIGISSIPGGEVTSQFFGFNGTYVVADTIETGKGYWVKVNQTCKLILSSPSILPVGGAAIHIEATSELPPPLPEGVNNSREISSPNEYILEQNYPNPFNPTTTIRYQLSENSRVTLRIYDMLGKVVATLVDHIEDAGYKSVEWNANRIASGLYFYRLEVTCISNPSHFFVRVGKMILMK